MKKHDIARMIDHTLLAPNASSEDIRRLCREAAENDFASVCIQPCYVPLAAECLKGSRAKVCTVIGFPLGVNCTEIKAAEAARTAVAAGADFVKTSTGFVGGGARVEDIRIMKEAVGDRAQIKASGGIHSYDEAMAMIAAGATRIGASAGLAIIAGAED